MSRALITCHDHSPRCTFGDDPCPISKELRPHWLVDIFKTLSTHFVGTYNLNAGNTDTMDIIESKTCPHTITGNILCDIPRDIYDIIIMPDCGGDFFNKQSVSFNELFDEIPRGVYRYQLTVFADILSRLKMGGRLIYGKMIPLNNQEKIDRYVSVLNTWYQKRSIIDKYLVTVEHKQTGDADKIDKLNWFVLYKGPVVGGGGILRSKSKTRSKSKARSKSKSRAKSKARLKSKSRSKSKKMNS